MNRQAIAVRACSMLLALMTSSLVIGATVVGMEPHVGAGDVLVAVSDFVRAAVAA